MGTLMNGLRILVLLAACAALIGGQSRSHGTVDAPQLPSTRSQKEEILKEDHKKNLEEAERLLDLAEQLNADLEKNDRHVLSVSTLHKVEEIEKLASQIQKRLKRY